MKSCQNENFVRISILSSKLSRFMLAIGWAETNVQYFMSMERECPYLWSISWDRRGMVKTFNDGAILNFNFLFSLFFLYASRKYPVAFGMALTIEFVLFRHIYSSPPSSLLVFELVFSVSLLSCNHTVAFQHILLHICFVTENWFLVS